MIGAVLATTATLLARESKELLIGERAGESIDISICVSALKFDPGNADLIR